MIQTEINNLGKQERPYFCVRNIQGSARSDGTPVCEFGRRLSFSSRHGNEGIFVTWKWDGKKLVVQNERYGIYPLYYSNHEGELRISPFIDKILDGNIPKKINFTALSVILRLGHCVGDDTPFEHIRVLPPNSTLIWENGQMSIEHRKDETAFGTTQFLSFDQAVDTYIELFDRAIKRRLPEGTDFTVPLSGGRDSRHILLSLAKQGHAPTFCPTLQYRPPATDEDMRIAGIITGELGIEHRQIARPVSWFSAVREDVHLTNYCGGGHSWSLPLASYLQASNVDTIYDGLAGSVLSGGFMLDDSRLDLVNKGRFGELARQLVYGSKKEGYNNTVLSRNLLRKASRETAAIRVAEELEKHAETANPLLSFIFWNRTRRMVGMIPYAIMSGVPTVHCPYLDHDLFDFLTSVEPSMFLDNRLHDEAIRRGYPNHAGIPFEDKTKRASMNADAHQYYRSSIKELAQYLIQRHTLRSNFVRQGYLVPRILFDLLSTRKNMLPWYMMTTVYLLELEEKIQ